tara:strand:- start:105 stop:767 length:663 start_codon:yes stop_codon:yes gene_type:complete
MKTACFIPIKSRSSRVPGKNFKKLNGKPLYRHALDAVLESNAFSDVYIDTDSKEVEKEIQDLPVNLIVRDPRLSRDDANGNDLLKSWIQSHPQYDLYFQIFVTSPFISISTIKNCLEIMNEKTSYDSIFTATEEHTWFWLDGKAVNYDPKVLPRSQDAKPMIRESTSLYGIRKEAFIKDGSRIGRNPYIFIVNNIEGMDIDTELDFFLAEKAYLYKNNKL